jgi:hypothetical protein
MNRNRDVEAFTRSGWRRVTKVTALADRENIKALMRGGPGDARSWERGGLSA